MIACDIWHITANAKCSQIISVPERIINGRMGMVENDSWFTKQPLPGKKASSTKHYLAQGLF